MGNTDSDGDGRRHPRLRWILQSRRRHVTITARVGLPAAGTSLTVPRGLKRRVNIDADWSPRSPTVTRYLSEVDRPAGEAGSGQHAVNQVPVCPVFTGVISPQCRCLWDRADDNVGYEMRSADPSCVLHGRGAPFDACAVLE